MRVFMIGAGSIAKLHAEAVSRLGGGVELHIADVRPEAAAALAAGWPEARAYASAAEMLALAPANDDVVVVATPVFAHMDNAIAAFSSGRHVLCEKPLAMNNTQVAAMLAAAESAGRRLGCCSSRFLGTSLAATLRARIKAGDLGKLYHVTWRCRGRRGRTGIDYQPQTPWFVNRAMSGGGVLMDWGPYDMSLLAEILEPTRASVRSAWMATPRAPMPNQPPVLDVEFHAGAAMVWHNERQSFHVTFERSSCTHGPDGAAFIFEGTEGAATYEWLNWEAPNRLTFTFGRDAGAAGEVLEEPMGPVHDRPLHGFIAALSSRGGPAVTDKHAAFNFGVIQAIYAAAQSDQPCDVRLAD